MENNEILLDKVDDTFYRITLNRADKGNSLNEAMLEGLEEYLSKIEEDPKARFIEVTAAGDRFFCTGGDIVAWSKYSPLDMGRVWIRKGNAIFEKLRRMPQLTVAKINGHTMGGGVELALCCDIKYTVPRAKFATPEVTLGMVSGWMGMEKVVSIVGPNIAREMLLLGKVLTAQEALNVHLVHGVFEKEEIDSKVEELHQKVLKCGPVALAHIKDFITSIESRNDQLSHQLLAGLMSATNDCKHATESFAKKEPWTFNND